MSPSPCHFSWGPLAHWRGDEGKKKRVALITFTPPAEKWCQFLLTLEKKNRIWSVVEHRSKNSSGRDITQIFTRPGLCSYLTKYTLTLCLLIQKYPFMSVFKCCPPYLFHLGFSSSCEYSWNWWGGGVAETLDPTLCWHQWWTLIVQQRYSNPAEFLKSGPLPLSLLLPSSSSRPPAAFLPVFSSKARVRHEEELNSTHLLQHTAINKRWKWVIGELQTFDKR